MGELEKEFKGFSRLSFEERLDRLIKMGALTEDDRRYLKSGGLKDVALGESFIENVVGYFQLPLGVATNFKIDGVDRVIPMAVEETSIVAAASKTARWVREAGHIETRTLGQDIIGQVQFAQVKDFEFCKAVIENNRHYLIAECNEKVVPNLVRRGGGVSDIQVRRVDRGDGSNMLVVHVLANPCDAMGANLMNQICEYLKGPLQGLTNEKVTMCILSNLVDSKLTEAKVHMEGVTPEVGEAIQEASLFALQDPYRAATNNKGVLNGIDPILVATGNDWRAVEAGVHAYACRSGQYRSITEWTYADGVLTGLFRAPLVVGIVGGVTALHPTAQMALKMLEVQSAEDLSRVAAAVGLVQNLGALNALTSVGIIEGHMKLHIKNLSIGAGASEKELPVLQKKLEDILSLKKRISLSNAIDVLKEMRSH